MAEFKFISTYSGSEPISLDEAKDYLRVSTTADNAYITSLISTARETIEKDTNAVLVQHAIIEYLDGFPTDNGGIIDLQMSGNVTGAGQPAIFYMGAGSVTHNINLALDTDFVLAEFRGRPRLQPINGWPTARDLIGSVKILYSITPITGATLSLVQAMYLLISHFYDNRSPIVYGSVKEMPIGYKKLIAPYKNFFF